MAKKPMRSTKNTRSSWSPLWILVIGVLLIIAGASAWVLWPRQSYADLMARLDRHLVPLGEAVQYRPPQEAISMIKRGFDQLGQELVQAGYIPDGEPTVAAINIHWLWPNHALLEWDAANPQFFFLWECREHLNRPIPGTNQTQVVHLFGGSRYQLGYTGSIRTPHFGMTFTETKTGTTHIYIKDGLMADLIRFGGMVTSPAALLSYQEINAQLASMPPGDARAIQVYQQAMIRRYWEERGAPLGATWMDVAITDLRELMIEHELGHVAYHAPDEFAEVIPSLVQFEADISPYLALWQVLSNWREGGDVPHQRSLLLLLDTYVRDKKPKQRTAQDTRWLVKQPSDWRAIISFELLVLSEFCRESDKVIRQTARHAKERAKVILQKK